MLKFDKHIFICTNQRAAGSERRSCGEAHGMEIVDAFRKKLKAKNLPIKVRAQRAGCLDVCNYGQTLVVYPEGIWYHHVSHEKLTRIIEEHLLGGKPIREWAFYPVKNPAV